MAPEGLARSMKTWASAGRRESCLRRMICDLGHPICVRDLPPNSSCNILKNRTKIHGRMIICQARLRMPISAARHWVEKAAINQRKINGPAGRIRTSTMFPPPDFESGASTNSATGAWGEDNSGGVCAVNAEMPLSEGRQRDAESLCAQVAPQALALRERVSVALNQSGALSPGLSWRPPAPYPPRMREGVGTALVPHAPY